MSGSADQEPTAPPPAGENESRAHAAAEARERLAGAQAHLEGGDPAAADAQLRRALDLAGQAGDLALSADVLRGLLKCRFYARDLDGALIVGMQALALSRESGEPHLEAKALGDLGLLHGQAGDFQGALEHLLAGLRLLEENGLPIPPNILNNVGNVYLELGDDSEALHFFHSARDAFRNEGAATGEAIALGNIGRTLLERGEPAAALEALKQSHALFDSADDPVYGPPALARVARAMAATGDDEGARASFGQALRAIERTAEAPFADEVMMYAGRFYLSHGELEKAATVLAHALELVPAGEESRRAYELREALSDVLEQQGETGAALDHYKEFHRIRQALSDSVATVRVRALMLQFDVERARQQEEIFKLRNIELARVNADLEVMRTRLEEKNRELHRISIQDSVTGLHNRRYVDLQIAVEIGRARRNSQPLCAALCDIDFFKEINDRFSHAVGDEVIRGVADILREAARQTDIVARYAGDEFLLLLPDTDLAGGEALVDRIRARVAAFPWHEVAEGLEVTLSVGLAQLGDHGDASRLIAAADTKMYEAKRTGRDRVAR